MLIELTLTPTLHWRRSVILRRPGGSYIWTTTWGCAALTVFSGYSNVTVCEGLKNTKMWYNYLNGPLFGRLICGCDTLNNIGTDRIVFTCNFDSILSHRAKIIRRLCTLHPKPFFPSVVNLWYRHLTTPMILQYVYCNHNPSYLENLTVYLMLSNAKALK